MPGVSPPRRRTRLWRVALVGLAIALTVLWLIRGPLLGPLVAGKLARVLTGVLGGPVEVRAAGGGWLHDAHVEGVVSHGKLTGLVRSLAVERLSIRYDLSLLGGDLTGLYEVVGRGLRVELGSGQGGAGGSWSPLMEWLPDPLPAIDVSGSLSWSIGGERLDIPGWSLIGAGRRVVLAAYGVTIGALPPQDLCVALERRERSTLALAEPAVIGDVSINRLEVTMGVASRQVVAGLTAWGGSVDLKLTPEVMTLSIRDVDMAALPEALTKGMGAFWRPKSGRLEAAVTATRDARAPGGWAVAASFAVRDGLVGGRMVQAMRGTAALTADGIAIKELFIDVDGGIHAQVNDLEVARVGALWLPRQGRAQVLIDDLRPLLIQRKTPAAWLPTQPITVTSLVTLAAGNVTVEQMRVATPGLAVEAKGNLAALIGHIGASELTIHADAAELGRHVPALAGAAGILDGQLRYSGPVSRSLPTLLTGTSTMTITGRGLAWRGHLVPRITATFSGADGTVALSDGEVEYRGAVVTFAGQAIPRAMMEWDINVERFATAWRGLELRTTAPMAAHIGKQAWSFGPLAATVPGGTLSATATRGDTWKVAVAVDHLDLAALGQALGGDALSGQLSAELDASGEPAQPHVQVRIAAKELTIAGESGTFALVINQDGEGIRVQECAIDLGRHLQAKAAGSWPINVGSGGVVRIAKRIPDFTLSAVSEDLSVFANRFMIGGHGKLSLNSSDGVAVLGELAVRDLRLRHVDAAEPGRRVEAPLPLDADLRLRLDGEGGHIGIAALLGSRPVLSGEVTTPGSITSLDLARRRLGGRLKITDLPIHGLVGAIPRLLHGTGWVSGEVALGGTVGSPEVEADLAISRGEFKLNKEFPTVTGVSGAITLRKRMLELHKVHVELGLSPGVIEGSVDFTDPLAPIFAIDLKGDHLLLAQTQDLRLRADADLHLDGPLHALTTSGSIIISDALYSRRVTLLRRKGAGSNGDQIQLFSLRNPPLSDMKFSVQIRTRPGHKGLRIATNLMRVSAMADLHLGGTGALPQPSGTLTATGGLVTLPFSTLRVEHAEIVFPPGDPFTPTIRATANTQVRQYTVSVNATGPVRHPVIRAASPGLEEQDALLLITAGSTNAELEDPNGQRAALGRIGTWLGRETWRKLSGPGNPDGKPSPLDQLSLEIGRAVSDTGRNTIEAEMLLRERPVGIYLYGERDRYDDFNMGFRFRWRWGGSP